MMKNDIVYTSLRSTEFIKTCKQKIKNYFEKNNTSVKSVDLTRRCYMLGNTKALFSVTDNTNTILPLYIETTYNKENDTFTQIYKTETCIKLVDCI